MKVALLGIEHTGKSAFKACLKQEYSSMLAYVPTKTLIKENITILGQEVEIRDFSGEKDIRDKYFENKEENFSDINLIYYFFNVKKKEKLSESTEYLKKIVTELNFDPSRIIIICTFVDPDVKDNEDIQQSLSAIDESIDQIGSEIDIVEETSIFDEKTVQSAFAYGIQKLASKEDLLYSCLENFVTKTSIDGILLVDSRSLPIISYVSDEDTDFVLESCVPFVDSWMSISIRQMMPESIKMNIMKGYASLIPINLPIGLIFMIVHSKNEDSEKNVISKIDGFVVEVKEIISAFFT